MTADNSTNAKNNDSGDSNVANLRQYNVEGNSSFSGGTNGLSWTTPISCKIGVWLLLSDFEFQTKTVGETTVYENTPSASATPVLYQRAENCSGVQLMAFDDRAYQVFPNRRRSVRVYAPILFGTFLRTTSVNSSNAQLAKIVPYRTGDRIDAFWNRQSDRWELIAVPIDVVRFQLTEPLVHSASQNWTSGTAKIVYFDQSSQDYVASEIEIEVVDFLNRSGSQAGDRGFARRCSDRSGGFWEICRQ